MALDSMQPTLTDGSELQGQIGAVCSEFLEQNSFQAIYVSNDYSQSSLRSMYCSEGEWYAEAKRTSKRYLNHTAVYLVERGSGPLSDPVVSQLPVIGNRSNVSLWVCTSNLSKQVVEFAGLLPLVSYFVIATPVTETIEGILEKTVEKKTLNCLLFRKEHQFNAATTKALLDLLKQDQFSHVRLSANCDLPLERIIAEWRENAEEMVGKMIFCQSIVVDDPVGNFGFQQCTEDEVDYLYRYHCQCEKTRAAHAFILRSHDRREMYVLADDALYNKNALVFA